MSCAASSSNRLLNFMASDAQRLLAHLCLHNLFTVQYSFTQTWHVVPWMYLIVISSSVCFALVKVFAVKRQDGGAVAHVIDASSPGNYGCVFFVVLDGCLVSVCGHTFEFGRFFFCHTYPLAYVVV
eukprot:3206573-Pyramimonas_sp.AAC.1